MRGGSRIFLVGPMGSGKSTIGRCVAKALTKPFVDLDEEIERRTGADIDWIFEKEGESGFRKRESEILAELASQNDIVLATGGGVVLAPENRKRLMREGTVVYLNVSPDLLYRRLRHDTKRPLLQVGDKQLAIASILEEREPLYREVADLVFSSPGTSVQAAARELVALLKEEAGIL